MDCKCFYLTELDRQIWSEELEDFVPARVFDAHTHLWSEDFATEATPASFLRHPVSAQDLQKWTHEIFPGREQGFMLLGTPVQRIRFREERVWLAKETRRIPRAVCGVLVTPETDPEELDRDAAVLGFKALKPYLSYAPLGGETSIGGMLPESLLEVAENRRLMIVLHVAKSGCFSDPENLADLQRYTKRYPHVVWQLAHCARSFNSSLLEKSIHILKDMENICYDLSAVCNDYTFYLLFRHEDRKRLLYGTDNLCGGSVHGTYTHFGRSWDLFPQEHRNEAALVCYEQLRCIRHAAEIAELSRDELEQIFWGNAVRIYGLDAGKDVQ